MKANTITLLGNVVVNQGGNVVRGERLVVDMTTGVSKVDGGRRGGPARMLIEQNKDGTTTQQPLKFPASPGTAGASVETDSGKRLSPR